MPGLGFLSKLAFLYLPMPAWNDMDKNKYRLYDSHGLQTVITSIY